MRINPQELKDKLQALEFDAHWYRRVFHAFGAFFLIYYIIPETLLWNSIKIILAVTIFCAVVILELYRINGKIDSNQFFGLRVYETKRPGSYLYFGSALLILLIGFPQQIAIPCILCGCLADPIIGEVRLHNGVKVGIFVGFVVCFLLFALTWYQAEILIILIVASSGACAALVGELWKVWWLDDDFMIQIAPAVVLVIIWLVANAINIQILPEPLLYPLAFPEVL